MSETSPATFCRPHAVRDAEYAMASRVSGLSARLTSGAPGTTAVTRCCAANASPSSRARFSQARVSGLALHSAASPASAPAWISSSTRPASARRPSAAIYSDPTRRAAPPASSPRTKRWNPVSGDIADLLAAPALGLDALDFALQRAVVAQRLDQRAGVRHGGTIAAEQLAHHLLRPPQQHVHEIHCELPGLGGAAGAARPLQEVAQRCPAQPRYALHQRI